MRQSEFEMKYNPELGDLQDSIFMERELWMFLNLLVQN